MTNNNRDKRIRAEVLAACKNAIRDVNCAICYTRTQGNEGWGWTVKCDYEKCVCACHTIRPQMLDAVAEQPAASALEELLRKAELQILERIRTDEGGVYVYCPERENTEGPAIIRLDVFIRVKKRQLAELEKARAGEKGKV